MTTTSDGGDASESSASQNFAPISQQTEKPVWSSEQIMQGQREVFIKHGTETYRLMLTKANKLILQK
jgi:hemin uptake protein HemP